MSVMPARSKPNTTRRCSVDVEQVDGAPPGGRRDVPARPLPVGQVDDELLLVGLVPVYGHAARALTGDRVSFYDCLRHGGQAPWSCGWWIRDAVPGLSGWTDRLRRSAGSSERSGCGAR